MLHAGHIHQYFAQINVANVFPHHSSTLYIIPLLFCFLICIIPIAPSALVLCFSPESSLGRVFIIKISRDASEDWRPKHGRAGMINQKWRSGVFGNFHGRTAVSRTARTGRTRSRGQVGRFTTTPTFAFCWQGQARVVDTNRVMTTRMTHDCATRRVGTHCYRFIHILGEWSVLVYPYHSRDKKGWN